ncbi:MAG TPA: hypothetical protein VHS96_18835 [Bacteroidia bacterium]|nr:hypothetical protein [Bacteroidia bacterium]
MKTQEVRHESPQSGGQEHAGTNFQRPPAFQLQANPVAPPRQQGLEGASEQEGQETEGGELGESGRVVQRQVVTPTNQAAEPPAAVDPWEAFAVAFSEHFRLILPLFDPTLNVDAPVRAAGTAARRRRGAPAAEATPAPAAPRLSAERLNGVFTAGQRDQLMGYFTTNVIPQRLFTGGDNGTITDGQRIAVAAAILAHGTHQRGDVQQRVHARDCGNWVGIVNQYAGLSPQAAQQGGPHASFDFQGNLVTSNARIGGISGSLEDATHRQGGNRRNGIGRPQDSRRSGELPSTESERIGPMQGDQEAAFQQAQEEDRVAQAEYQRRLAAGEHVTPPRLHTASFGRMPQLSWSEIETVQPGNWIWEFNANSDPRGMHSVIFIRWVDQGPQRAQIGEGGATVTFRRALCFSQPSAERGGVSHQVTFGDRFVPGRVHPVNRIMRSTSTAPGITSASLVPRMNARETRTQDTRNQAYLRQLGTRFQLPFQEAMFMQHLREQNAPRLRVLMPRMSPQQSAAFEEGNRSTELYYLLMLYQRLEQLVENAEIVNTNIDTQVTGPRGLNARHATYERHQQEQAAQEAARRAQHRRRGAAPARPAASEPYSSSQAGRANNRSAIRVDGLIESAFPGEAMRPFFAAAPGNAAQGAAQPNAQVPVE